MQENLLTTICLFRAYATFNNNSQRFQAVQKSNPMPELDYT